METLFVFIAGFGVGWVARSFVTIPQGHVVPGMGASTMHGYGHGGTPPRPLRGKIVSCDPKGHVAPDGLAPMGGYQSDPLTSWCYLLAEGETAGDIAAAITGEEARYQELVLSNPSVPTVGTPGRVGPEEWNFAPGGLASGARVMFPQTWNPWIDQLGQARGRAQPFREDQRTTVAATGAMAIPALPYRSGAADLMPLQPHEAPPYGRAFSYARG